MNFGLGQDIQYPRAENDTESMAFVKTKRLVIDKNNSQNRLRRELCVKLGEKKKTKAGDRGSGGERTHERSAQGTCLDSRAAIFTHGESCGTGPRKRLES